MNLQGPLPEGAGGGGQGVGGEWGANFNRGGGGEGLNTSLRAGGPAQWERSRSSSPAQGSGI